MKLSRLVLTSSCVVLSVGALAGCSGSVESKPAESSSAVATGSATPGESSASASPLQPSASGSADASDKPASGTGDGAFESIPFDGSPASWGDIEVEGAKVRAIIPDAKSSADGSIVWKNLGGYQKVEFSVGTPDGTTDAPDMVVKVITADDHKPQVELVPAGTVKHISVDTSSSSLLKIVWHPQGKPSSNTNIVFYNFVANQ